MNSIIPAILVHDEKRFRERLKLVESLSPIVQIDVMDGAFVPNSSWCDLTILRELETPAKFELHLMVQHPEPIIREAMTIPNIARILWHVEATGDHQALLALCHDYRREAGLALSPKTPLNRLTPYIEQLDEALLMGVEPGFSGQSLLPGTIERIREIHAAWPELPLAIDGGVTKETIPLLRDAGITRFCAASALFETRDIRAALQILEQA